jgi:hypothetical protein
MSGNGSKLNGADGDDAPQRTSDVAQGSRGAQQPLVSSGTYQGRVTSEPWQLQAEA